MAQRTPKTSVALVVVTYRRQELLEKLFDSILTLDMQPDICVIVDNEDSELTADLTSKFAVNFPKGVKYLPQPENLGGAGGFHQGVKYAVEQGFDWIWLMDDDVAIFPDALARLRYWMDKVDTDLVSGFSLQHTQGVIQGQRVREDGTLLNWQNRFLPGLAIANPARPVPPPVVNGDAKFAGTIPTTDKHIRRPMNLMCFEGCIFRHELAQEIGYPDSRFFVAGDDTVYGYLAAKVTQPIETNDLILHRTRPLEHLGLPTKRLLSNMGDLTRYYMLRNRGHLFHYVKIHGDYHPIKFGVGTFLSTGVELVRAVMSDNLVNACQSIWRGLLDHRKIMRDANWNPES